MMIYASERMCERNRERESLDTRRLKQVNENRLIRTLRVTLIQVPVSIDLSRIRFSDHETVVQVVEIELDVFIHLLSYILSSPTTNWSHFFAVTQVNSGKVYYNLVLGLHK
jgi:hypothetical protein